MIDNTTVRNRAGSTPVLQGGFVTDDNLAIALCTYFSFHPERPEDDPLDDEVGWGKWVIEKTDDLIDRVIQEILDEWRKGLVLEKPYQSSAKEET